MTVINVKQADGNDDTRIFITIVGQDHHMVFVGKVTDLL